MLVITAGTSEFAPIVREQRKRCLDFGYRYKAFDLGGLGFGIEHKVDPADFEPTNKAANSTPPTKFKMQLLLDWMVPGELCCWLDGDCLPLRQFEPEGVFDVAVTLRPENEIGATGLRATDYLNAGVVFVRDKDFVRQWKTYAEETINDQDALNRLVYPLFEPEAWRKIMGKTIRSRGRLIQILDAMEWNCWHLPPKPETRILHFKRGIRSAAKDYLTNAA